MRQRMCGIAFAFGLAMTGATARAQLGGMPTDPFSLYYGFYLPRQAAMAVLPRAETPVNQLAAIRQHNALTDRAGLYDPVQPFGSDYDPANPFSRGRARLGGRAVHTAGGNGNGPPMYYTRVGSYYQSIRSGHSVNANVAAGSGNVMRMGTPRAGTSRLPSMPSMPGMPY